MSQQPKGWFSDHDWMDTTEYDSDSTEWLMQPNAIDRPKKTDWELEDMVALALSSLSDIDQRMLQLIYQEGRTFEYAAKAIGIRAKSHAWRKTKLALDHLEETLMSNPRVKELLKMKYGIGANNEEA